MTHTIEYAKEHFVEHGFAPYSNTYVATNEDLRSSLKSMPQSTAQALTVAASGDHPMFAKLYGAKNIDTFDISFNAKLIMDIKTNALGLLNYQDYCQLLKNLYKSTNIAGIKNISETIKKLTSFEQQYISEMVGKSLFNKQINDISLPTQTEFQQMRQLITKPFNFIQSDLQTLHEKLNKTYDFIHLSNIFDYTGTYRNCIDILYSLLPHTNTGCTICITCFNKDAETVCENFLWNLRLFRNPGQEWLGKPVPNLSDTYCVYRVR